MSSFETWTLSCLLNSLWQIPLLCVAGWLAARALRPLGPAAEHRVWIAVLLLESLLPIASALPWLASWPFSWPLSWLAALIAWRPPLAPGDAHVSVVMGGGFGLGAVHPPAAFLTVLAIAYIAITAYCAARFLWRCARLRAIRRDAVPVTLSGEFAESWARCAGQFAVSDVSLATSTRIFGPVSLGWSRRLVLLPPDMLACLPEADFRAIVAHEFAHIRRGDFLRNLICEFLALPVNYHPCCWFTRERVMETREILCDRMAAASAGRQQYARSLLRLASLLLAGAPARTPHTIGIFDAGTLERRLMKLTETRTEMRGLRRVALVAACAALGLGTCASALALRLHIHQPIAAIEENPPQPSGPIHVSSQVMAGNRISGPIPHYPEAAKKARIQGTVVLNATIGKDGTIENLVVESGPKELQQSSLDAVSQWIYKPFLLNGEPVEVETTVNVVYSLGK